MPHVPLRELEEENQSDEGNSKIAENNFGKINVVEDLPRNLKGFSIFGKLFKKPYIKRYKNKSKLWRLDNVEFNAEPNIPFLRNETSESDSEEEFQEEISLVRRTETKFTFKKFESR